MTCYLSKGEFCEIICNLRDANDLVDSLDSLINKSKQALKEGFCSTFSLMLFNEDCIVTLLEKIMRDSYNNISYFIYELDYGRKYKPGIITDSNGENLNFSTEEKLYDYLVKEHFTDKEQV